MIVKHALVIGLAGFVGAILRYAVTWIVTAAAPRGFPYGTLTVNLTGCFFLGILFTLLRDRAVSDVLRLAVGVGFLGAYTTFSTFAYEVYDLGRVRPAAALTYASASLLVGLAAVWAGIQVVHFMER